jgi:hypothetical protein
MTRRQKAEIAATAFCIAIIGATCSMAQLPFSLDPLGTLGWTPKRTIPGGWWKAEDNALDSSGNGYHGTWIGTAAYGDGKVGRAFSFDGKNTQYISAATNISLSTTAGSIAAWVRRDAVSDGTASKDYSIGGRTAAGDRVYLSASHASETMRTGLGNAIIDTGVAHPATGTWYHACISFEDGKYAWYLDGEMRKDGTYTGLNVIPPIGIGGLLSDGSPSDAAFFLKGLVDDVVFWPRALTADEIKELYNRSLQREGAPWRTME